MTRQIINPELTRNTREPAIRIEKKLNCWICGQEIKEGELFVGTLKKETRNLYHASCWKAPESHGWMA